MPFSSQKIASQFIRQFSPDAEGLVYRRLGRGPAFRVTEGQTQEFLARYIRATNRARLLLVVMTIAAGAGGGLLLAQARTPPSDTAMVAFAIANVLVLVGGFVWADLRNQSRPDRELSAESAPVAPPLDEGECMRARLIETPWVNFAFLPLVGLFIVWTFRGEVDPFAGWGRAMWLVPAAFTVLASIQASRKRRAVRAQ